MLSIFFFFAFMILGSDAYRGSEGKINTTVWPESNFVNTVQSESI